MFFTIGKSGLTDGWRYGLGMLLVIAFYMFGQAPMLAVIKWKISSNPELTTKVVDEFWETTDFTILGISSNMGFVLLITIFTFATLGLYLALKLIHQKTFKSIVTAFEKIDYSRIFVSWTLWLFLGCLVECFYYLMMPENYAFEVAWSRWSILVLIALIYLPVQSSLEEFVFRGYLMQGIGIHSPNKLYPLIITSILFALPHSFNPEVEKFGLVPMFTYYILAGLVLGIIVIMDNRLELALGVHAATNFMGATILGYEGSVLQTDTLFTQKTVYPTLMTITFICAGGLFLLACQRMYKWGSFTKLWEPIKPITP